MISLEKANSIISNCSINTLVTSKVNIEVALNRVLAEDVFTDMDYPSFRKSAMDGYAIRQKDICNPLQIIEFIPAGKMPEKSITSGTCSKIMTGAMIPEGADMVVMKEDVTVSEEILTVINQKSKANIINQGEYQNEGALLLQKGISLSPVHIGLLASVGKVEPLVYRMPVVSVLSTGSELVSPEERPSPPMIRDSNSAQLVSLIFSEGAKPHDIGHVPDNIDMIFEKVYKALTISDIVVLTGGASVGDHDFSEVVFNKLDAKTHFTKLAIQPGKPVLFATAGKKFLFCLSGNPVSSFVQFQLLIKPLLSKLVGKEYDSGIYKLPISCDKIRKKADRIMFFPVKINQSMQAEPLEYFGSGHLHSYQKADGIASFPIGLTELNKGTIIDVRRI